MTVTAPVLTLTSIVDNRGDNTLLHAIERYTEHGRELAIASAFFSLDALNIIGPRLHEFDRVRLLFGDAAAPKGRLALMAELRHRSDSDLFQEHQISPALVGLRDALAVLRSGKLEARCYTARKFHAKAYLIERDDVATPLVGFLGSGNFTRQGLMENVELNALLTIDQAVQLRAWYEERWNEAVEDDATFLLEEEIERHVALHEPYLLYLRALLSWGDFHFGASAPAPLRLADELDPHQITAFDAALQILRRENGVMICDGVGLGKSFVALALMEYFLRQGKRTLLIAPKSVLDNSWHGYLAEYLDRYRGRFGLLDDAAMTDLGFRVEDEAGVVNDDNARRLRELHERADVVVIDESHNFRKTSSLRYQNLYRALASFEGVRKQVILLTATPVNTHYADIAAQLALIAHDGGRIAAYRTEQITKAAKNLDNATRGKSASQTENLFTAAEQERHESLLSQVFRSVIIQRKRETIRRLAEAAGKELLFPIREDPCVLEYSLTPAYTRMVRAAKEKFEGFARYVADASKELSVAIEKGEILNPAIGKLAARRAGLKGLKFAAYLPQEYRRQSAASNQAFQRELFLAKLVFANVMKQLESSPAAFQGILQSLGLGLAARLRFVFKEGADDWIQPHVKWTGMDVQSVEIDDPDEEGEDADLSGEEMDEWAERAMRGRGLRKKLAEFTPDAYHTTRWRDDILSDLALLKDLHEEVRLARGLSHDPKLESFIAQTRDLLAEGRKVLVFTQSVRTSRYLGRALAETFPETRTERIDSTVDSVERVRILHAFSPTYNRRPLQPDRDIRSCDLLVCTDVLSEGVNMQEAGAILNYDIHWNPVRLIQRIGRVDRRLKTGSTPHKVAIVNILPPHEIESILKLVGTVEGRTIKISRSLGLENSFFKSTDPAGNLREFNAQVDGVAGAYDDASVAYTGLLAQHPDLVKRVRALPPGSLGVWHGAPEPGLFALFTLVSNERAAASDLRTFHAIIGRPVLAFMGARGVSTDAPALLSLLAKTVPGEPSGQPSDLSLLGTRLEKLRNAARQTFRDINLPGGFELRLDVWMELVS